MPASGPTRWHAGIDTNFVLHELRVMKRNVTIALDDELARWLRIEAARRDTSVSAYLADLLSERQRRVEGYSAARDAYLGRKPRRLRASGGALPSRAERHERERSRG